MPIKHSTTKPHAQTIQPCFLLPRYLSCWFFNATLSAHKTQSSSSGSMYSYLLTNQLNRAAPIDLPSPSGSLIWQQSPLLHLPPQLRPHLPSLDGCDSCLPLCLQPQQFHFLQSFQMCLFCFVFCDTFFCLTWFYPRLWIMNRCKVCNLVLPSETKLSSTSQ